MTWTIFIKLFFLMIFFSSRWFNTGRCINNTLFLWCINANCRSFPILNCLYVTPRTLSWTNTKKLWCESKCSKTQYLGKRKWIFWCHKWLLPSLMYLILHINTSASNEPILLSNSVYSVQNMCEWQPFCLQMLQR